MRRDLVGQMYADIAAELFEDVLYTPSGGAAMLAPCAISGILPVDQRIDTFGNDIRARTHTTRGLLSALPGLTVGALIKDGTAPDFVDGTVYRVLDLQAPEDGDGRFEVMISLAAN